MWLFTPFGFFSVVKKDGDMHLTIRARVARDLDGLRARYLPELSATISTPNCDYSYRASASHHSLANAMVKITADITYDNFKNKVAREQGHERASIYNEVWRLLDEGLPNIDAHEHGPIRRVDFGDGVTLEPFGIDVEVDTPPISSSMCDAVDVRPRPTAPRLKRQVTPPRKLRSRPRRTPRR